MSNDAQPFNITKIVNDVPEKWAVLIGIELYQHPEHPATTPRYSTLGKTIQYENLRGCVNDVLAIEQYLIDTTNVNPKNITKLLAPFPGRKYISALPEDSYHDPTYKNIVNALQEVCQRAKKGDFIYIHFSGHGTRAITVFPTLKDRGADDVDQVLVPSDITRGGRYIRDLEMGILLQAMVDAGLVVTVVLDCSFSGGPVRGNDDPELGETRSILDIYKSDPQLDLPGSIDRIMHRGRQPSWIQAPQGFVVLVACLEHEKAAEMNWEDHSYGLLTYWLLEILRNSPVDISSQALFKWISAKVKDHSQHQTPYLAGDIDRFLFSEKRRSRVQALMVREAMVDTRKEPVDRWVHLTGGKLHGVEVGSEYTILPLSFDFNKPIEGMNVLGRVRVTEVKTGESVAFFTQVNGVHWEKIEAGCPVVQHQLPIVKKATVHFIAANDKVRGDFEKDWHRHKGDQTWLRLNKKGDMDAFFAVAIDGNGNFEIRDQLDTFTTAIRNAVKPLQTAAVDSMPVLIRRLEHLARFKMTEALANPGMRPGTLSALISARVDAAPKGMHSSGQWVPPAEIRERNGTYEVSEMALIRISIKNHSGQSLGCVVLNCAAELSVKQVFPSHMPFYILHENETKEVIVYMTVTPELRASAESVAYVDTLKIFACNPPKGLESLQLQSLRDMEDMISHQGTYQRPMSALTTSVAVPSTLESNWETVDIKIQIQPLKKYRLEGSGGSIHPSVKHESFIPPSTTRSSPDLWEDSKYTKTDLTLPDEDDTGSEAKLADDPSDMRSDDPSDMRSVYSERTDLSSATEHISGIAHILLQHLGSELANESVLSRILAVLEQRLREFAIQLGHEVKSQEALHAMVFIRHYREHIATSLKDMWYDKRDENRAEEDMPSGEKVKKFLAALGKDMETPVPQNDFSHAEPPTSNDDFPIEHPEERVSTHEPDADVGIAMELPYRDLIQSQAFQWLLTRLLRELHLTTPKPDNLSIIRKQVLSVIPTSGEVSRSQPVRTFRAVFKVDWDPRAFVKKQQYRERADEAIATAITLTGCPNSAQTTTTIEYLEQTWPISGKWTLHVLQDLVLRGSGHFSEYDLEIAAFLHGPRTIVEACGTTEFIAELGEQLAWLGSALRSSDFNNGVAYCTPRLRSVQSDTLLRLVGRLIKEPRTRQIFFYEIDFVVKQKGKQVLQEGTCWHDLFRNPVVVEGFPIPCRAEHGTGLGIPLHIVAGLIRARRATDFDGRLFIKSFSTLLFPTKFAGDVMTWHVLFNEDGSHISYLDPRIRSLQNHEARGIRLVHLTAARVHVLGWCSEAENYAGSPDANYPIRRSGCDEARASWILDRFNITAGKYINIGMSFSLGNKDKPLRLWSSESYHQQILQISNKFVLLYDVGDRRGWLVNGASALLHLVIASLKYEKSTAIGSKYLSDVENLNKVGPQRRADTAIETLIDQQNMDLPILPGKNKIVKELEKKDKIETSNVTFSDRVEQVFEYLEKAFIYQEDKMYRSGYNVNLPFRRLLEGFDFAEIAESEFSVPPRIFELKSTGKAWIDFVRKIRAVTLFGRGFGDIISPTNACASWSRMPIGVDYLAVCVHDLNSIIKKSEIGTQADMQIVPGIFWHMPDKIFEGCACKDRTIAPCDRAQVLLPIRFKFLRFTKRIVPPGTMDSKENGAVIFGTSKKLPVNWPEDPEEIAEEGRLTPESSDTVGTRVATEQSASSSVSGTQESEASTSLTSGNIGAGSVVDHPESSSATLLSSRATSEGPTGVDTTESGGTPETAVIVVTTEVDARDAIAGNAIPAVTQPHMAVAETAAKVPETLKGILPSTERGDRDDLYEGGDSRGEKRGGTDSCKLV